MGSAGRETEGEENQPFGASKVIRFASGVKACTVSEPHSPFAMISSIFSPKYYYNSGRTLWQKLPLYLSLGTQQGCQVDIDINLLGCYVKPFTNCLFTHPTIFDIQVTPFNLKRKTMTEGKNTSCLDA